MKPSISWRSTWPAALFVGLLGVCACSGSTAPAGTAANPPRDADRALAEASTICGDRRGVLQRSKVDPLLSAACVDWARRRAGGEAVAQSAPNAKVLIELSGTDTRELSAAGITFEHSFRNFFSAEVPLDRLDELSALATIVRIDAEAAAKPNR